MADKKTFESSFVGDSKNAAFVGFQLIGGIPTAVNLAPMGGNYETYKKIVGIPTVIEVDVDLDINETSTLNFSKPVYIDVVGRYCIILELQAKTDELCTAKLLIINQTL